MKNLLLIWSFGLMNSFTFSQVSENVNLLYHWDDPNLVGSTSYDNTYNEVYGFIQNGKEYAVIGSTFGTHIFDVTDPINAYLADTIPGASRGAHIIHRDYKYYKGYLYMVCDEGGGVHPNSSLQIADLSYLPDSVHVVYDSDSLFYMSHNIFIDTAAAKLYACSVKSSRGANGLEVYSLANPEWPDLLKTFHTFGFIHDCYSKNDTVFLNAGSDNGLQVVSFTDPQNPQSLGSLTSYPFRGYNHSGWINQKGNIYAFADEGHGKNIKVADVSDLTDITVLSTFTSGVTSNSIPHNLIIKGDYVYVSYYYDGLQIFNIADPENPFKTGYYDTSTEINYSSYKGAWGVYPLLPSGIVLISDMQNGLFVFDVTGATEIEKKEFKSRVNSLGVFPNPFSGNLNISLLNHTGGKINYEITDMAGRIILTNNILLQDNTNYQINTSNFAIGFYLLKITGQDFSHIEKLVKIK